MCASFIGEVDNATGKIFIDKGGLEIVTELIGERVREDRVKWKVI
jgi:hypothetical protein